MANKTNGANEAIAIDTPAVMDINSMTDEQILEFQRQRRI
jgi:hypothetical protein